MSDKPPAEPGPAIRIRDLAFSWRRRGPTVLDIPELTVARGERVFIKGASGSGKSTLLSLLGGVVTPQRGQVHVLGCALHTLSGARRDAFRSDHIGFIFQMFNLIPYLSVQENVLLPCRFSRVRHERARQRAGRVEEEAERLLAHLGLEGAMLSRSVIELSVGQQQRVAAARALIGAPELLIADEPTSALDADRKESFLGLLLRECAAQGITLVFVSHDASLESLFDRSLALARINRAVPAEAVAIG
jgi:putative ABC transport system ATP-binding protein